MRQPLPSRRWGALFVVEHVATHDADDDRAASDRGGWPRVVAVGVVHVNYVRLLPPQQRKEVVEDIRWDRILGEAARRAVGDTAQDHRRVAQLLVPQYYLA